MNIPEFVDLSEGERKVLQNLASTFAVTPDLFPDDQTAQSWALEMYTIIRGILKLRLGQ